jgi:hypothetical protein
VCTIACPEKRMENAPTCVALGSAFTGKCGGQGYCQSK